MQNLMIPTPPAPSMSTAQIGKCGEFLVQYRLLQHAIESSPMATDAGIDLVAYAPASRRALTIQVKTNLRPKPAGGEGPLALDWWGPEQSPAQLFALVDLGSDQAWLFSHEEIVRLAQQKSRGQWHFYLYVGADARPKGAGKHVREFEAYKIENRIPELFGLREAGAAIPSRPKTTGDNQGRGGRAVRKSGADRPGRFVWQEGDLQPIPE
jgi:hypothetical protein